jgi:fucose permease
MIGYVIGIIAIPKFISQKKALITVALLGTLLSVAVLVTRGEVLLFDHRVDISIWFFRFIWPQTEALDACEKGPWCANKKSGLANI